MSVRQFELYFLSQIGFAIDFILDQNQRPITAGQMYHFTPLHGFKLAETMQNKVIEGNDVLSLSRWYKQTLTHAPDSTTISPLQQKILSFVLKQQIDCLLHKNGKQLVSRQLWI